jgi:hypothetical protein
MRKRFFGHRARRILGPVRKHSAYKHDPLLINSLTRFNFRPPLLLVFPGEQLEKNKLSRPQFSTW